MKPISELRDNHAGSTCRIIGKGISLRYLLPGDIGDGPIIAISESIVALERIYPILREHSVYSLQKDLGNYEPRDRNPVLLSFHESENDLPGYEPSYVFNMCDDLHLPYNGWSAVAACEIARLMGCTALEYICCDVMTTGDRSTYDPLKGTITMVHGNYDPLPMALLHHLVSVGIKTTFTHPAAAVQMVAVEDHRAEMDRVITEKFNEDMRRRGEQVSAEAIADAIIRRHCVSSYPESKFVDLCPTPKMGVALP